MKKIFAICLALITVNYSFGQVSAGSTEKKRWPSTERIEFIKECIISAKDAMSEDSARQYCYCMQERVEAKYPTTEEAAQLTEDELELPHWQEKLINCLTASQWKTSDRKEFIRECVTKAKQSLDETKAKSYCECMLFKVEQQYPKPADSNQLTSQKLNSPEWKKRIQDCLEF